MPGIALAETPEDRDLDLMNAVLRRAVARRVRVTLYEPGPRATLRETARLPRRGRVAHVRRRRDRGDRRGHLDAGRREARDRDDGDDDQRVAARRCRFRDERRLRASACWASSPDDFRTRARAGSSSGMGLRTAMLIFTSGLSV